MNDTPTSASEQGPVPIGKRIAQRLNELGQSQAWLAKQAGLEASTVSRIIKGTRCPTLETLEHVARAFGMTVEHLVHGTNAATLLQEAARLIPREHYEAAVKKVAEYETKIYDLEFNLRNAEDVRAREQQRRETAERDRCQIQIGLDRAELDRTEAHKQIRALSVDLREHRQALHLAVAEVSTLRSQLTELAEALKENNKTTRTTALLAGIAALTGGVTVAHFLRRADAESSNEDSEPFDSTSQ